MRTLNLQNVAIKRPDKDDVVDLLPLIVGAVTWYGLTDRKLIRTGTIILPILTALIAWLLVKGLRYVPR